MKNFWMVAMCLATFSIYAQNNDVVKITLDGKPALLNTKTGETKLVSGEVIKTGITTSSDDEIDTTSDIIDIHIVKARETLYSISKQYNVSIAQIKAVNGLTDNTISIDQKLKIGYASAKEVKPIWTVAKGDTLYAIAKKTGVSVAQIKQLNNLESNLLQIGQQLKLK